MSAPRKHAPDCQSHIVDVRGRPDECTCGAGEPARAAPLDKEALAGLINSALRSFELNGGNVLDAIATYHNDATVAEALEIVGDWSAWLADAIAKAESRL